MGQNHTTRRPHTDHPASGDTCPKEAARLGGTETQTTETTGWDKTTRRDDHTSTTRRPHIDHPASGDTCPNEAAR